MPQLNFDSLFLTEALVPQTSSPGAIRVSPSDARQQFIKVFRSTAPYMHRNEVFRDFITLAASELDAARIHTPENIEQSKKVCARYQVSDIAAMKQLFCLMVRALEGKFHDFLGSIYMDLELSADEMGQYFSPYELSLMLARLLMPGAAETIKREGWLTLDEPACGGAGMVIAFAQCMAESDMNHSEQLFATCTDIDPLVADMAFIQLSLLGIPARVVTGNTLTMTYSRVRCTPVYYINSWHERIALRHRIDAMRNFLASVAA